MKAKIKTAVIILLMIIASVISTGKTSAQQGYVSFQVFYDQLSPYGDWVNSPEFDYIWIPDAGPDFFPYSTEGRWIFTDYGWTWLSYYDWGWAPFHYGRWDYNDYYGWFWIPDNKWGPAWVSWRRAEGYYGWEPMGPGISISMSFGRQNNYHSDNWIFVRERDFNRPDIDRYYVNRRQNDRIIRSSTVINNTYSDTRRNTTYVTGPAREEIQKATGRNIKPVSIQEYNKPGHDVTSDHVSLYMPEIRKNNNGQRSSPSRITQKQDVIKPSQRKSSSKPSPNQTNQINNKTLQPQNTTPQINPVREEQQNTRRVQQQNTQREQQQNTQREQQQNTTRQQDSKTQQQQNASRRQNTEKNQQTNVTTPKTEKKEGTRKSEVKKENKENH